MHAVDRPSILYSVLYGAVSARNQKKGENDGPVGSAMQQDLRHPPRLPERTPPPTGGADRPGKWEHRSSRAGSDEDHRGTLPRPERRDHLPPDEGGADPLPHDPLDRTGPRGGPDRRAGYPLRSLPSRPPDDLRARRGETASPGHRDRLRRGPGAGRLRSRGPVVRAGGA